MHKVYEPQIRARLGTNASHGMTTRTVLIEVSIWVWQTILKLTCGFAARIRQLWRETLPGLVGLVLPNRLIHGYRGNLLIRNRQPVGPYSRTMPRHLWWCSGGVAVSYERGAPVEVVPWEGGGCGKSGELALVSQGFWGGSRNTPQVVSP